MKSIKIKNDDGNAQGTLITDAQTGAEIHGVTGMQITFMVDDVVRAQVDLCSVTIETVAAAEFCVFDPGTGERKPVRRIEFADGSKWDAAVEDVTTLKSTSREYVKKR